MDTMNAKDKDRLRRAVEGRNSTDGHIMDTKASYAALLKAGYVEANETIKHANTVAIRATDAGVQAHTALSGGGTAVASPAGTVAGASTFQITKGIPIPNIRRRVGSTESKYPFDALEIEPGQAYGDSFHVPATASMPNPAKALASSVTSANLRFAKKLTTTHTTRKGNVRPNVEFTRKFAVRAVGADDPQGKGARVWRVAVDDAAGATA